VKKRYVLVVVWENDLRDHPVVAVRECNVFNQLRRRETRREFGRETKGGMGKHSIQQGKGDPIFPPIHSFALLASTRGRGGLNGLFAQSKKTKKGIKEATKGHEPRCVCLPACLAF